MISRGVVAFGLCAMSVLGVGCKFWVGREEPGKTSRSAPPRPKPVQSADARPAKESNSFPVDSATGRAQAQLILRLDHFPDPNFGKSSLPVCYKPFPDDFRVGTAVCAGGTKTPVTAANLAQECYTEPTFVRRPAQDPLKLTGCNKARIQVSTYEPPLYIDVETGP